MDGGPLGLFMVGLLIFLILFIIALGLWHPSKPEDYLNWRPTRSPKLEAENEIDDVVQMLEATNEKRARRGLEPLSEEALTEHVHAHRREMAARRDAHLLDTELQEVLDARNERRRRRGLPEMSLEELKASLEGRL
jgi:hypothetical protein